METVFSPIKLVQSFPFGFIFRVVSIYLFRIDQAFLESFVYNADFNPGPT